MSHMATERLRLQPAPDGLAIVQDLLNTRAIGRHADDLLATVQAAQQWLQSLEPAADIDWVRELSDSDVTALRELRADLERLASGVVNQLGAVARATLVITADGELQLQASGLGWRRFAASVWTEVFLAQRAGTWKRLKLCHNPPCASAFYDRSKNNSGVWHDVKMCGNAANLRASRARRRQVAAPPAQA